jgi:hypothetical protein
MYMEQYVSNSNSYFRRDLLVGTRGKGGPNWLGLL